MLVGVVRRKKQRIDRLIAFEIENAEHLAAAQRSDPRLAGKADFIDDCVRRIQLA